MLDGFAHAEPALQDYQECFRRLQSLVAEEQSLSTAESAREQELDLLRHQVVEITSAKLQPNEEEEIVSRYKLASNSRRLIELATSVSRQLSEADNAVLNQLAETQRLLRELEKIDPNLTESSQAHAAAVIELTEIARTLDRYAEKLDLDPEQLAQLEQRVTLLETLKRKYGGSIPEVIAFGERAADRMRKIEGRDAELERLAGEIKQVRAALERSADALAQIRAKAAPKLAATVRRNLTDLGFRQAEFAAQLTPNDEPRLSGTDSLELLFSPKSGRAAQAAALDCLERRNLASDARDQVGAWRRRTRFRCSSSTRSTPTSEARSLNAVGAKMRTLAEKHQVLCITHLPQVARRGDDAFRGHERGRGRPDLLGIAGSERQSAPGGNRAHARRQERFGTQTRGHVASVKQLRNGRFPGRRWNRACLRAERKPALRPG